MRPICRSVNGLRDTEELRQSFALRSCPPHCDASVQQQSLQVLDRRLLLKSLNHMQIVKAPTGVGKGRVCVCNL